MAKRSLGKTSVPVVVQVLPIAPPEILGRDVFADMLDDQLANRLETLSREAEFVNSYPNAAPATAWEVEIAYTQRELGLRAARRQAHEQYVARCARGSFHASN